MRTTINMGFIVEVWAGGTLDHSRNFNSLDAAVSYARQQTKSKEATVAHIAVSGISELVKIASYASGKAYA